MTRRAITTDVVAAVTVLCGVAGLVRYRYERRAVLEGRLPVLGSGGITAPPRGEDPLSALLARWVPRRPRSRAGRLAATVWCSPLTAVGLVLGLASGGRWRRGPGCVVVSGGRRGPAHVQARLGFAANAVGQVVLARPTDPPGPLIAHEAAHVRQAERLGPAILPVYLVLFARWGYRQHPLERAARHAVSRWAERSA